MVMVMVDGSDGCDGCDYVMMGVDVGRDGGLLKVI
jgi:hypothetical protein